MTAPAALPHGTASCYTNHGCRRDECRAAATAYRRSLREKDPEKHRAAQRRYRSANPEKIRAQRDRRRARVRAARATAAEQHAVGAAAVRLSAAPFEDLIEARARALAVTIAQAPLSATAREARIRRAELLALLAKIRQATA